MLCDVDAFSQKHFLAGNYVTMTKAADGWGTIVADRLEEVRASNDGDATVQSWYIDVPRVENGL